jgi:aminoglycoside 6'-N-acetyltransferase
VSAYRFRPVTKSDVRLLRRWRARPHVVECWGAPEDEDPEEVLADARVTMWIVEHEGRPIAYAQDYSPSDWTQHPFAHLRLDRAASINTSGSRTYSAAATVVPL